MAQIQSYQLANKNIHFGNWLVNENYGEDSGKGRAVDGTGVDAFVSLEAMLRKVFN